MCQWVHKVPDVDQLISDKESQSPQWQLFGCLV